jgi:DNA-directed RNA polymerase subunit RPC12/RpoP
VYDDKTLICRDCRASFTFTRGEQDFYERKGFEGTPSRCPDCRSTARRSGSGYSGGSSGGQYGGGGARVSGATGLPEQLFTGTCARCGQNTQVSARLIMGDGTIYCPDCTQPREAAATPTDGWRESW